MELGAFQSAEGGYAGIVQFLGQPPVAVAIIPEEQEELFKVRLVAGKKDMSLGIGQARVMDALLEVTMDTPILKEPIKAHMALKADPEGYYILKWERAS